MTGACRWGTRRPVDFGVVSQPLAAVGHVGKSISVRYAGRVSRQGLAHLGGASDAL